ncbi:MAG: polyprenyl synthetase family protein [Deltaproteobacteria bacterium]|nr:polyprenyl synthetase family protein [Deltaproteobacteria bacterium]MBI3386319.1 polyprenyl synthetase family protein [Deltaproteobacteria bacterium]
MNLESYLARRRRQINRQLTRYLPVKAKHTPTLIKAMRHSLLAGGKRLRPILALAAAEAVGGAPRDLLPFVCALEMVHTYSLVHDDLPSMDDDDLRRGQPTCHVVYGEAVAILAGDALLTEAFRVMVAAAQTNGLNKARALQVIHEIAEAAGARGMVSGQVADIEAEHAEPSLALVEFIHVRKTGALLLASVRTGALLSGANASTLRHLTRYGECLGLAFQIADDILDAEGTTSVTGKRAGRDRVLSKVTFPAVMGIAAAKARARDLLAQALDELQSFDQRAEPMRAIARYVVTRAGA